jgi:hypothetical protein
VYYLGITKVRPNEDKKEPLDILIKKTVTKIILDFFDSLGDKTVLIFHYESDDNKQHKRSKCFGRWYNDSGHVENFIVNESTIETYNGENLIAVDFIGLILTSNNQSKNEVLDEFHRAKENLIGNKE